MKNKLLALIFLAGGAVFGQVSVGVRIGPPPPPRVVRMRQAAPGPDFFWVDGYWYPAGNRYRWHDGYWTRRPYDGATWIAPRHDGDQYYTGYWEGEHGRVEHDHRWDRERDRRDWNRPHDDRDRH